MAIMHLYVQNQHSDVSTRYVKLEAEIQIAKIVRVRVSLFILVKYILIYIYQPDFHLINRKF